MGIDSLNVGLVVETTRPTADNRTSASDITTPASGSTGVIIGAVVAIVLMLLIITVIVAIVVSRPQKKTVLSRPQRFEVSWLATCRVKKTLNCLHA